MRTVNKLAQADMVRLADFLRSVCKEVDGVAVYPPGWDDDKVVAALSGQIKLNKNNVAGLRKSLIGNLPDRSPDPSLADLKARIEKLEAWAAARPVVPFK